MKQDVQSHMSLANELIREEKWYEAIYILEKIQRNIEFNDSVILFKLATCYSSISDIEEAKKYADLAGMYGNWDVQAAVSTLFDEVGDYAKSIYWLIKSAENGDPDSPYTLLIKYNIKFPIKPHDTPEYFQNIRSI